VQDPEQCIREVARVLKSGGRWLFLEHVAAHQSDVLLTTQTVLDPLQVNHTFDASVYPVSLQLVDIASHPIA
jgi:ubiquinone/menaquinone biosynthesis C-methylase UbiE